MIPFINYVVSQKIFFYLFISLCFIPISCPPNPTLLQHHCEVIKIVTTEQAGGKKDVWGCLEQLLINKTIVEQVKTNRRSLVTMWLDYQKVFDSIPHKWLVKALELAKVPKVLINALKHLTTKWHGLQNNIVTEEIKYSKGIFHGDSLSVILFILCVNPLSFLLNKMNGYKKGGNGNCDQNITNIFLSTT